MGYTFRVLFTFTQVFMELLVLDKGCNTKPWQNRGKRRWVTAWTWVN